MTSADEGQIESDSEDFERLEPVGPVESHAIFAKFHNSSVGHFGVENTLKAMAAMAAMAAMGHDWRGMRKDVRNWISECAIYAVSLIETLWISKTRYWPAGLSSSAMI
jgi:Integrase zinc binding domain